VILFAGIPSEPPIALGIEAAERMGVDYAVFNQRRSMHTDLQLQADDAGLRGALWLDEKRWDLTGFSGIYARTIDPASLPENRARRGGVPNALAAARSALINEAFNDWLEVAPGRVVNRPSAMSSNCSKPYQLQLIREHGFHVPPTLVTNDPELLRRFHARHGRVVFKSISSVRSIVTEWGPHGEHRMQAIRNLPTQFQALITGRDVRVHVIGDTLFATEIATDAVDYRYAVRDGLDARMTAVELPSGIAERCVAMTHALGLAFAGIDLKRTPDDRWYCFEVNTSPGYSFFQEQSGQPVADVLVSYLAGR